ncbi:hypothetical protein SAMN04488058_1329 [Deinococcus reticulitermitis]|uniref:Uncharacterized protein n=1 Tax=Deinococcus reticulitermitis TaxID=856736 RepID=A0A1H7CKV6_9DEIO|nr:hypothetical protein [Deinococcus reticulitermitis]SEJ90278.1 hypothetical protein SAMN04488058_1329 [Deinococcus reticulitermitis]
MTKKTDVDPATAEVLSRRPRREPHRSEQRLFGACSWCGQRSNLFDDGECGSCKDEAYLTEWQEYAAQLESALIAAQSRPAPSEELREGAQALLIAWQERFDETYPKRGKIHQRRRVLIANAIGRCRNELSQLLSPGADIRSALEQPQRTEETK